MIGARIGHIRLEALLGEGGMGRVYRGWNEVLERPVAVKTLRHGRLHHEAQARLLREARLLSRLDHPHICRVYDLVEGSEADYLILELVEGSTLTEVAQKLSAAEKLRVAEEIASALAAAHRQSIVHRDLKPDNVMLTPAGSVKVLDFGVARPIEGRAVAQEPPKEVVAAQGTPEGPALPATEVAVPRSAAAGPGAPPTLAEPRAAGVAGESSPATAPSAATTLTVAGSIVGTLAYMSPEQARGEAVTTASDLYSFGLLLQRLLIDSPTYAGGSRAELLLQVAGGRTLPPQGADPDVAALLRDLLRLAPEERPTAEEARRRLAWIRARPVRRRRRLVTAALAGIAAVGLALTAGLAARWARPAPLLPAGESAHIALLPFVNDTGDAASAWVDRGMPELVERSLAGAERWLQVPLAEAARAVERLTVDLGETLAMEQVARLAEATGANLLVQARVETAHGGGFRLVYTVYRTGRPPLSDHFEGATLAPLAEALAARLAQRLDPGRRAALVRRLSDDPYANEIYAMGVQRAAHGSLEAAQPYFQVCLDRDAGFHWAKARLAQGLFMIGDGSAAEPLFAEVLEAARESGDHKLEATALRAVALAASTAGDHARAQELLHASLAASEVIGDQHEAIDSLNNLASNAYYQGDLEAAEGLWAEVAERAAAIGYWGRQAGSLSNLAAVAYQTLRLEAAEEGWGEAHRAAEKLGDRLLAARILQNLALAVKERGRPAEAEAMEREVLAAYRELGYGRGLPAALVNLGQTRTLLGDLEEAQALYDEGYEKAQALGQPALELRLAGSSAMLAARRGDFAAAEELLERGAELLARIAMPEEEGNFAQAMAEYLLRRGRWPEAGPWLDRAEAWREGPAVRLLRARWEHAQGHLARALELAEEARELPGPWGPLMEEELATHRQSAAEGRPLPLP